jgi:serine/threonine-protein kinase RsbT
MRVRVIRKGEDIVAARKLVLSSRCWWVEPRRSDEDRHRGERARSQRSAARWGRNVERDGAEQRRRRGLRLAFEDQGPGIADVPLAMKDGYTSGGGLRLGLGGAKRLSNEFEIASTPGAGTRVTVARWK